MLDEYHEATRPKVKRRPLPLAGDEAPMIGARTRVRVRVLEGNGDLDLRESEMGISCGASWIGLFNKKKAIYSVNEMETMKKSFMRSTAEIYCSFILMLFFGFCFTTANARRGRENWFKFLINFFSGEFSA